MQIQLFWWRLREPWFPNPFSLLLLPLLPMSSIVDKWTAQFAKLREKSRAAFSGGNSCPAAEPEQTSSASRAFPVQSQAVRIKSHPSPSLFSEAALSMLVDCVSP